MKIVAYLSASKDRQDIRKQKQDILAFARREQISISCFIEVPISSKTTQERKIDLILSQLSSKDTLVVSELSRIGWSLREIVKTVDLLLKNEIRFVAIKENIAINNEKKDLRSQVMVEIFGLFAEIEHQLVSQRAKSEVQFGMYLCRRGTHCNYRHKTGGTWLYEATGDLLLTQEALGHQSPETTRRYVPLNRQRMRVAMENFFTSYSDKRFCHTQRKKLFLFPKELH